MFILSTDIDGTIYQQDQHAQRFQEYWKTLLITPNPPLLIYNTGRSVQDTLELIATSPLPTPQYIIGGVGTAIYDPKTSQYLTQWPQELDQDWNLAQITQFIQQNVPDIQAQPSDCQNPHKSSWFWHQKTTQQIEQLKTQLAQAKLSAQVIYSTAKDLDIIPLKANKGQALTWLLTHLNQSQTPTFVAGDSGNDQSMFQLSHSQGIIPANAEQSLKQQTTQNRHFHSQQTCSDGVIDGLQTLLPHLTKP